MTIDKMRAIMSWALIVAGALCYLLSIALVGVVWDGGWLVSTEAQRLSILGTALLCSLSGVGATIWSLALGGPIGKIKGSFGKDGGSFEAEDDKAS